MFRVAKELKDINFEAPIMGYLEKLGITTPTPIQALGWPVFMEGRDMVGVAETGSGKTLSFALPIVSKLNETRDTATGKPRAIILSPTRELSIQTCGVLTPLARLLGQRVVSITSGQNINTQQRVLHEGVDIVVGTPGRILALLETMHLDLSDIKFAVLDEADRMLDMGFKDQIDNIVGKTSKDVQMVMWSATWPKQVEQLSLAYLKDPVRVIVGNEQLTVNKRIDQQFHFCNHMDKESHLVNYLKEKFTTEPKENRSTIIFVNMKVTADEVTAALNHSGLRSVVLHGGLSKSRRDMNLDYFKSGSRPILVATDVAARGVDIKGIKTVINYDFPTCIEDYVHRIGRTARGKDTEGTSFSYFTPENYGLAQDLRDILLSANLAVPEKVEEICADKRIRRSDTTQKRYTAKVNNYFGGSTYGGSRGNSGYGSNSYGNNSYGNNSYGNKPYGNKPYGNNSYGSNNTSYSSSYGNNSRYNSSGNNKYPRRNEGNQYQSNGDRYGRTNRKGNDDPFSSLFRD
jgi:ATP-dependent RNA helicase DDX5/DBP2